MNSANQHAAQLVNHPKFAASPGCARAANDLIVICDAAGYSVRFFELPSAHSCGVCSRRAFPGSSICRACGTVWVKPKPLSGRSASPAELVVSFAHEVGHLHDPPEEDEPDPASAEGIAREREREHAAWSWAEEHLRHDPAVWREVDPVFDLIKRDRLAGYAARWTSA